MRIGVPVKREFRGKGFSVWHYNSNGKRNGPVDGATIIDLHKRGEISDDTLLWNQQLGNQWARFDTIAEFKSSNGSEPPPLPASAIGDQWAFLLALTPLLVTIGDALILDTTGKSMGGGVAIISFVLYVLFVTLDLRVIELGGRKRQTGTLGPWILLTPIAYNLVRDRRLQKSYTLTIASVASLAATIAISGGWVGSDIYLGAGIPACDSRTSVAQVKEIFPRLPMNFSKMNALAVNEVKETANENAKRTCTAKVLADNGETYGVTFTIEERDGQFLYFLMPSV